MSQISDYQAQIAILQGKIADARAELAKIEPLNYSSIDDRINQFNFAYFNKSSNGSTTFNCWGASSLSSAKSYVDTNTYAGGGQNFCREKIGEGDFGIGYCGSKAKRFNCDCSDVVAEDCTFDLAKVNEGIKLLIQAKAKIDSLHNAINGWLSDIDKLNNDILNTPESQTQIQSAVASAKADQEKEKAKWIFFGLITMGVLGAAFLIGKMLTRRAS